MDPPDAGLPHSHTPITHTHPYPFPTSFSRQENYPFTSYITPPFPLARSPEVVVSPPILTSSKSPANAPQPQSEKPKDRELLTLPQLPVRDSKPQSEKYEDNEALTSPKLHAADPQPQLEYEDSEGSENLYMTIVKTPTVPSPPTTLPSTPPKSRNEEIDEWVTAVTAATAHENGQRNRSGEALQSSINTLRFPQRSPPPPPPPGGAKKVGFGITSGLWGGGEDDKPQPKLDDKPQPKPRNNPQPQPRPNGVPPPDPYPNPSPPPKPPATNSAKKSGSGPNMVLRGGGNDDGASPRPSKPECTPDGGQSIFKLVDPLTKLSEILGSYEKFHGQLKVETSVYSHMAYWNHIEVAVEKVEDEYDRVSFMRQGLMHAPEAGILEKTAIEIVRIWRPAYEQYEQASTEPMKIISEMQKVAEYLRVELERVGAEKGVEMVSEGTHGKKIPRNPRYEQSERAESYTRLCGGGKDDENETGASAARTKITLP